MMQLALAACSLFPGWPRRNQVLLVGLLFALCVPGCGRAKPRTVPVTNPGEEVISEGNAHGSAAGGYVGDRKCSECHDEVAQTYRRHSMGNSLAALTPDFELRHAGSASFEADGFRYSTRRDGTRWIQRQARIASDGSEVAAVDAEVKYVVGSGHHGQSFLVDRDGYLFMSPMTWYPDKDIWHLSPGYEKKNSEFNRPVVEVCLYCHANRSLGLENTLNHYQQPIFLGYAIGCERCHGPGAGHVSEQEGSLSDNGTNVLNGPAAEPVTPIVNPGKLEPLLRDAVCEQCHLSGVARVLKPGKKLYDYRPGQPLTSTYTIFTVAPGLAEGERFVGHAEQMHQSTCYQASQGKLGCISCHDPHGLPAEDEKVRYYRDRCLRCHTEDACGLSPVDRRTSTAEDNCIVCHMPKLETEVRHAATTNHRVPRNPEVDEERASPREGAPLIAFPSDELAKPTSRDLALAIVRATGSHPELIAPAHRQLALTYLRTATAEREVDVEAMEALIDLYVAAGDVGKAMNVCRRVLDQAPQREQTLTVVGDLYSQLENYGQAIPYWKRAIDVNPWMSHYWYQLGLAYAKTQQWFLCRQMMRTAKVRFPTSIGVRQLLVESNLQLGDQGAAESEFREIEKFNPRGFGALRDWYQSHPRRK